MKKYLYLPLVVFSFVSSSLTKEIDYEGLDYNEDVLRIINLEIYSSIEVTTEIKFKSPNSAVDSYYYVVPRDLEDKHMSIQAKIPGQNDELKVSRVEKYPSAIISKYTDKNASDLIFYKISLPKDSKNFNAITVKEHYKRRKEPFPAKIDIQDDMQIKFQDSKYYLSLYPTKSQRLHLIYDAQSTIFNTPDPTAERKSRMLKYGPFKDVPQLSYERIFIHYKHNVPLPIFTDVKRTFEISHWGNILVDEYYNIFNEAAGLKGEFGRVDYQHWNPNVASYALKSMDTDLPRYIRGLYYWDFIGNISSSNAFREVDKVKFQMSPRFPIFGQWRTDWNQGYSMPTRYHLFQEADRPQRYIFNSTFVHDFSNFLAENFTITVILPEGATNIKFHSAFPVDSVETGLYFSILDFIGRPMITITKSNVHKLLHDEAFQVSYDFSSQGMMIEPLYVIVFFFVCYLIAIVSARMNFSLDEKKNA